MDVPAPPGRRTAGEAPRGSPSFAPCPPEFAAGGLPSLLTSAERWRPRQILGNPTGAWRERRMFCRNLVMRVSGSSVLPPQARTRIYGESKDGDFVDGFSSLQPGSGCSRQNRRREMAAPDFPAKEGRRQIRKFGWGNRRADVGLCDCNPLGRNPRACTRRNAGVSPRAAAG